MFRLAHVSDLHLGPLPAIRPRELVSKRFTGWVNWRANRGRRQSQTILAGLIADLKARGPDFTAITGDLVNLGLPAEFAGARRWLDRFADPARAMAVCGNHDAYVPGALAAALAAWQPYVAGDDGAPLRDSGDYPAVRRRDGVSIVACNSARASLPFLATGYFRAGQAARLAAILDEERRENRIRVVLIHHPPAGPTHGLHKRLSGAVLFRRALAQCGAELVLHGHTHVASLTHLPGPNRPVPVVGVPAAGETGTGKRPAGRYNWFEIDGDGRHPRIAMREFGYRGDAIAELASRQLAD
jgi:3',5'-cyclic AMP phosphodiesterase CpdA